MVLCSGLVAGVSAVDATAPNVVGRPSGTITLDGSQLPLCATSFGGKIEDGALQSTTLWCPRVVPPAGLTNVVLILTDDSGFGARAQSEESSRPKQWARWPPKG